MTKFNTKSLFAILIPFVFLNPLFFPFELKNKQLPASIQLPSINHQILEIDANSVQTVDQIGGGIYYRSVDAIVPLFPSVLLSEWLEYKNAIVKRMGPIESPPYSLILDWSNTATSIDQLIKDATQASPKFWEMCLDVSKKTGCRVNAGHGNQHMVKNYQGIKDKAQKWANFGLTLEQSVSKIRDALRATLVVDTPEQIPFVINSLKDYAHSIGREFVFINIWNEQRPSGYVGIHSKMLFPIQDKMGRYTERNVIVEIQIHLKCMMDGTKECAKERVHSLYKQMKRLEVEPKIQTAASMLIYLTALKRCPKKNFQNGGR